MSSKGDNSDILVCTQTAKRVDGVPTVNVTVHNNAVERVTGARGRVRVVKATLLLQTAQNARPVSGETVLRSVVGVKTKRYATQGLASVEMDVSMDGQVPCVLKNAWYGAAADDWFSATEVSGDDQVVPISAGVGAAVLVVIIVIVVIIIFRRRRQRKRSPQEFDDGATDTMRDSSPLKSDGSSTGLMTMGPQSVNSKPQVAVKPMSHVSSARNSENVTSGGPVYSNIAAVNAASSMNGNPQRTQNAETTISTNLSNKQPTTAPPRPSGRNVVYENVAILSTEPARPAQASPPPIGPKPVAHPAVTNKRSQGDDMPELDDDDEYNSEDLYGSFKSLSSTQQLDAFQRYLIACLGSGELADQFDKLPKGMTRPHKIGLSEENKRKNRFKAMCTYDFNRVILRRPEGDNSSDYINATYINGADREKQYIATQGPRVNTIDDLWWMVWQEGITQIVMLANLQEDGKDKCEQYWPASGKSQTCGHVTVRAFEEQERADYVIRSFLLKAKGSSGERQVTQYHYMAWPDHGVPLAASLVDYWRYVKGRTTSTVPLLVHCSAGVGRTGTFIALDIAYDQESRGRDVNVNEIVTKLREERCLMVQSEAQYKFLHEVILEAHTSRDTRIPMNQFDVRFPGTIRLNTDNAVIDKEFLMLKQMGQFAGKAKHTMATMPENLDKNRNMDALPDDDHVVYLNAYVRGRNQYINGVYMSSFQQQKGFVLTQLPIPDNTLVDFWRLVEGCGVSTVISIGSEEEEKTVTAGEVLTTGPYKVTLTTSTALNEHASSYKLAFKTPSEDRSREVELLHYRKWAGEVPSDTSSLLQLVDTVKAKQTDDVTTSAKGAKPDDIKPPVVVQCIDGAAKSGLFCALYDVISRVTYDEEVDVYLTAREVQRIRPQAVATQTQYRYLYQALQEYIRHLDVYQNV
ncbi:hypothetical protein BaRGS_00039754 [Batillaria attramentaria]|uniref:protein-tyrosine-phosphatase n=1 Tax=Batillaria attramentaria TaxID=370345 RepID=A0ABD0J2B7_9CAEN